jgi:hypothetical protein
MRTHFIASIHSNCFYAIWVCITSPVIKEEGKCGVRIKNKNKEQEHEQAKERTEKNQEY